MSTSARLISKRYLAIRDEIVFTIYGKYVFLLGTEVPEHIAIKYPRFVEVQELWETESDFSDQSTGKGTLLDTIEPKRRGRQTNG